ncbi:hypothetical protein [Planctomicrobium piriforme]|uniref:Uncharacterized protein n=1 Tax=Planctomicrobium piriforme TaxID=1576369 RepID=A0A1I3DHR3_9PLAN|nr:hypothetical protein [Planctomicrobium piriforme]SFH86312.1 hypothetical protein SAMN05421753_103249 [Planctomicrobium piriforme]
MTRRPSWILAAALTVCVAPGCTGMFTKRAIERFAESMQAQNLDDLKGTTSEEFEQKALRQKDAAKGLKMLKIPTGKVEIVSVEEIEDGKRKALVKVGEKDKAKEVEYILTKAKGGWVIHDVLLKQDSGGGQTVERSVTEQMDLLLTCRELLIAWREGQREEKLAFCDESLQTQLQPLPPAWFEKLAKEIAGPSQQSTFKPDARLNGEKAFVVVPHPQGSLFLELHQTETSWKLHDLAIEPSSKDSTGIRALSKVVAALNQSAQFLNAYGSKTQESLTKSTTRNFKQCLTGADLDKIPLPVPTLLADAYEARQFTDGTQTVKRVELLLHDKDQTFMLTLREEEPLKEDGSKGLAEFRVDEVTLFEKGDKDVRRMSSVFLTHAVVHLYVAALRDRDMTKLKELSSSNFNDRVWNRPEASFFAIMPDPELAPGEMEVLSTVFRGDVSEVTVVQGETPMTLVLHMARGWMVVDDVLLPAMDRPTSLKENLEVLLTVQAFASAMHRKDLAALVRHSAEGLDRIAWRQLSEVPPVALQFQRPLMNEVTALQKFEGGTVVRTSDGNVLAEIKLVREGENFVVHDVMLIAKNNPEQRMELMPTLRQMIAEGSIGPAAQRRAALQQAAAEAIQQQAVRKADFDPIDPAVYTR